MADAEAIEREQKKLLNVERLKASRNMAMQRRREDADTDHNRTRADQARRRPT
jgi:hypothetical protein